MPIPPHHPADALAASDLRVDHAADVVGADEPGHAHGAQRRVHAHLRKHRAEGPARVLLALVAGLGRCGRLEPVEAAAADELERVTPSG